MIVFLFPLKVLDDIIFISCCML